MDLYKYAAQVGMRFQSERGLLTVEQLFTLPLKSTVNAFDLNTTAQIISKQLKSSDDESFVDNPAEDQQTKDLKVAFDIVKDVIATKQSANSEAVNKLKKTAERKKILDALTAKKDAALTEASVEELEKKLAALEE